MIEVAPYLVVVDPRIYSRDEFRQEILSALARLDRSIGVAESRSLRVHVKVVLAEPTTPVAVPLRKIEEVTRLPEMPCNSHFALEAGLQAIRRDFEAEVALMKSQNLRPYRAQLILLCEDLPGGDWVSATDWFSEDNRLRVQKLRIFCRQTPTSEVQSELRSRLGQVLAFSDSVYAAIGEGGQIRVRAGEISASSHSARLPSPGQHAPTSEPKDVSRAEIDNSHVARFPMPRRSERKRIPEYSRDSGISWSSLNRVIVRVLSEISNTLSSITPVGISTQPPVTSPVQETVPLPSPPENLNARASGRLRSANGGPVVGDSSTINGTPWWESGWWTVGRDEGFREVEIDVGTAGPLAVMGLTTRGQSHRYDGRPNQDSFALLHDEEVPEFLFLALSDGVSAAKHSAYSSRLLVREVVRHMHSAIKRVRNEDNAAVSVTELREIGNAAFAHVSAELLNWNSDKLHSPPILASQISPEDLSATLTVAVVPVGESEDGSRKALVGFVGDSPCYTLINGTWQLVTPATKAGAVVNTSTAALPFMGASSQSASWLDVDLPKGGTLFLMSDGFGTSLANGRSEVGEFLRNEWNRPRIVVDFLESAEFDRAGEDDDRTVVAVWAPPFATRESQVSDGLEASSVVPSAESSEIETQSPQSRS